MSTEANWGQLPTAVTLPSPHFGYAFTKRVIDIVLSVILIMLLTPAFVAIAILVKLTSPGPVFFRQERCGAGGEPFMITKFRSMVSDAEARLGGLTERAQRGEIDAVDAPAFKSANDPRVTTVGKYLRLLSLDELPQLFDVLAGHMSLVGPRPLVFQEALVLTDEHQLRHVVKPGITCIWQVSGRSRLSFEDRMAMDVEYVRRRSLWLDLVLIWSTPAAVLRRDGAC
jgi:lipopolysaccharide/colanic/teichoic acid biosynthesis glycosyltransferase